MTSSQGKIGEWVLFGLSAAGAIGAFITGTLAGDADEYWKWRLIAIGVLSTAIPVMIARYERTKAELVQKQTLELTREVGRSQEQLLSGITLSVRHVARIGGLSAGASPTEIAAARGRLDQSIVFAASEVHPGTHGAFYRWDVSTGDFILTTERPLGAAEKISPGDHGHGAFRAVVNTGSIFHRASTRSPLRRPTPTNPDQALLLVRVIADSTILGVLAVDASHDTWDSGDKDFAQREIRQVLLYADTLAAGLV
ncbi:hypothetical protein [Streptomyces sp. NPDC050759]|uniref:hypothetical protein n=1 Tax=Streptomyces sp. NPDC050759 TaxID=3365635 RepID=UPI0037BCAB3C